METAQSKAEKPQELLELGSGGLRVAVVGSQRANLIILSSWWR